MKQQKISTDVPICFQDRPIFGLDIGHSAVRAIQIAPNGKHGKPRVLGYGATTFGDDAIKDGVIERPEVVAEAAQKMFKKELVGHISTHRVALSVPVSRAFTRYIEVPAGNDKDMAGIVKTEVEQYIPAAPESLYIDYTTVSGSKGKSQVFVVAVPRKIVDSYLTAAKVMGLEPILIQTSSSAGTNLFSYDSQGDLATVLVDFGSESADITIFDKHPIVSGTAACGGEQITEIISKTLGVTKSEAMIIKSRYGLTLSKKQAQIEAALKPTLSLLTHEVRRNLRYYEEHSKTKRTISQIIIMGGGANMPGLSDYLTSDLRIPVRSFDPMSYLDFGRLQPFNLGERMSYVTAAGLALVNPAEVFRK